jgi:hypothetical protein
MFLMTQSLQLAKGYTPLAAAIATSGPIVLVNYSIMPQAPRLIRRFGVRPLVSTGVMVIGLATLILSRTTVTSGYANLFIGFALMAVAFSSFIPASTEAIMTAVPPERSGGASAMNQLTRQLGQSLGVALAGSIAASGYRAGMSSVNLRLPGHALSSARASITGALAAGRGLAPSSRHELLLAAQTAFLHGVRIAMVCSAVIAGVGALFAALLIPGRGPSPQRLTAENVAEEM